ncbi:MAG: hypothetical protein AAFV33_15400, partial [Chloroflexota bacterium]
YLQSNRIQFAILLILSVITVLGAGSISVSEAFKGIDSSPYEIQYSTIWCTETIGGRIPHVEPEREGGRSDTAIVRERNYGFCRATSPQQCTWAYPVYIEREFDFEGEGICYREVPDRENVPIATDTVRTVITMEFPENPRDVDNGNPRPTYVACEGMELVSPLGGEEPLDAAMGQAVLFDWTAPDVQPQSYTVRVLSDAEPAFEETVRIDAPVTEAEIVLPTAGVYAWEVSVPGECRFRSDVMQVNVTDSGLTTSSIEPAAPSTPVAPAGAANVCEGLQPTSPTTFAYEATTFYWDPPVDASNISGYEVQVYDLFSGNLITSQRVDDPSATNMEIDMGLAMLEYSSVVAMTSVAWNITAYSGDTVLCQLPMEGITSSNVDFNKSPWDTPRGRPAVQPDNNNGGGGYCQQYPQHCS